MRGRAQAVVDLAAVRAAAAAIRGGVETTPCVHSRTLSQLTGADVYLKLENLQFTGSFKDRGALAKLLSLSPKERRAGVVAVSAGNHAQGVAYHAQRLGVAAVIVMPRFTPNVKIEHTRPSVRRWYLPGKRWRRRAPRPSGWRTGRGRLSAVVLA